MKKFISMLILSGIFCGATYADNNQNSFQKKTITNNNGEFIRYQVALPDEFYLSFYIDTKKDRNDVVPVLSKHTEKYQPVSIGYCVDGSDDCFRVPLYGDSLAEFAGRLDRNEDSEPLVWKIEYIDNNKLKETEWSKTPDLGALSIYTENSDPDSANSDKSTNSTNSADSDPIIIWQSNIKNY